MKTIDHALEVACRVFSDGAKIDMDAHDDADRKTSDDMKKVCKIKSAEAQEAVQGNFRVQEPPPGKDHKWHDDIHQDHVCYLLQGIELILIAHGKRGVRFFKYADGVINELLKQPVEKSFNGNDIMRPVGSKEVAEEKHNIAD